MKAEYDFSAWFIPDGLCFTNSGCNYYRFTGVNRRNHPSLTHRIVKMIQSLLNHADFSKGERGKFYVQSVEYSFPDLLDSILMEELTQLASLIEQRNQIAGKITAIIGRPAQIGHIGEYIASRIFQITLQESASTKSIDGHFVSGQLVNCSVNIKWNGKQDGLLDITTHSQPDYYLVLTGPHTSPGSSRGEIRPWVIESVYLFKADELVWALQERGTKIGVATSLPKQYWKDAEIYPAQNNQRLILSAEQKELIALFGLKELN